MDPLLWPEARIVAEHYVRCYGHVPEHIQRHLDRLDHERRMREELGVHTVDTPGAPSSR